MDDGKQASEGASSESQPSSVGKLIDAAVDTGAELVKGKLKKAAKRKLPQSITRAKKSSKKAKKSSAASKAKKAPAKKSKAKSVKKSRKTKATKRK